MRSVRGFICLVLIAWLNFYPLWANSSDALALQQRLVEIFEHNQNAIVRVKAAYRNSDSSAQANDKLNVLLRVGTGFFISKEGHVLVSASRAAGASRVWIEYKGESYAAEPLGHDQLTNIAVLRVLEPPADFTIIPIDTTVPRPELGALVVAIACPLDFEPSPSIGIITGYDKKLGSRIFPTTYTRTSIPVDSGQGGCPILDINGRFIGMSVAAITELKGSYALPPDAVTRVRDDLLFAGRIIHGWIGLEVKAKIDNVNQNKVYISRLSENAPAQLAGLEPGDQLLAIGDRKIEDVSDVPSAIFFTRANQFTSIRVARGDEKLEFSVKALPRPDKNPFTETTAEVSKMTTPEMASDSSSIPSAEVNLDQ